MLPSTYLTDIPTFIEMMPDAIVMTDERGCIELINAQTESLFGYERTELLGQTIEILVPERFREKHIAHRQHYNKNPQVRHMGRGLPLFGLNKNSIELPIDIALSPIKIGGGLKFIAVIRDITERKKLEDNLKYLAEHDPLTGLINRLFLEDRITQAIALIKRNRSPFALCFIDLDGFKKVNDVYGHTVGDLVLRAVTESMQKCIREVDTLARIGGDEFVLLLLNINHAHDALIVVEKILHKFRNELLVDGKKFIMTLSIGIALYAKGDTPQTILKKADAAMYYVKHHGKDNIKVYNELELG